MTPRQAKLFNFIAAFKAQSGGISPSFDEMKAALGLQSKSGIHRIVGALIAQGKITILPYRARSIDIVERTLVCPHCGGKLEAKTTEGAIAATAA